MNAITTMLGDFGKAYFIAHPFITFFIFAFLMLGGYMLFHMFVDSKTWDLRMALLRAILYGLLLLFVFISLVLFGEANKLLW